MVEMNDSIIRKWNSQVECGDIVYHLGDFSLGNLAESKEIRSRLRGEIYLIRGNHDSVAEKMMSSDLGLRRPFVWIKDVATVKVKYMTEFGMGAEQEIFMSHYGHRVWPKRHYGTWHLFGHSHGTLPDLGKSFDVGWKNHGKLLSFHDVKTIMEGKTSERVDEGMKPNRHRNQDP